MTATVTPLPLRTICLGRHVVDVPVDIEIRGDVDLVYGLDKNFKTVQVEVLRSAGADATFDSEIAARVAELTRFYDAATPSKNKLAQQRRIDKDTVLVLEHRSPTMMGYYRVLAIAKIGEAIASFKADVYKQDKPEDIESKVLAVVRNTRYAAHAEPQGKGTCLGPLIIDAGQDGERFTIGARGKTHLDLSLSVSLNSMLAETDGGLLNRVDSKAGVLAMLGSSGSTLRRGGVDLADRRAEELINEDKGDDGKAVRLFVAETLLTAPSTLSNPRIHVEMRLGGQVTDGENKTVWVDPSLGKAESLALWDSIVRSIRLRPGSV